MMIIVPIVLTVCFAVLIRHILVVTPVIFVWLRERGLTAPST